MQKHFDVGDEGTLVDISNELEREWAALEGEKFRVTEETTIDRFNGCVKVTPVDPGARQVLVAKRYSGNAEYGMWHWRFKWDKDDNA
jgi:hypothetical protein